MKITKLPDSENPKKIAKKKALDECKVCPGCGETKTYLFSINRGCNYGITPVCEKTVKSLNNFLYFVFIGKIMKVMHYKCYTCGCEYESEPYEKTD